jgi:hypothetical protein
MGPGPRISPHERRTKQRRSFSCVCAPPFVCAPCVCCAVLARSTARAPSSRCKEEWPFCTRHACSPHNLTSGMLLVLQQRGDQGEEEVTILACSPHNLTSGMLLVLQQRGDQGEERLQSTPRMEREEREREREKLHSRWCPWCVHASSPPTNCSHTLCVWLCVCPAVARSPPV